MTSAAYMPVKVLNGALDELLRVRVQICRDDEPTAHRIWEIEQVILEALVTIERTAVALEELYEAHGASAQAVMPCGACFRTRALIGRITTCATPGCEFPAHDLSAHPCGRRADG